MISQTSNGSDVSFDQRYGAGDIKIAPFFKFEKKPLSMSSTDLASMRNNMVGWAGTKWLISGYAVFENSPVGTIIESRTGVTEHFILLSTESKVGIFYSASLTASKFYLDKPMLPEFSRLTPLNYLATYSSRVMGRTPTFYLPIESRVIEVFENGSFPLGYPEFSTAFYSGLTPIGLFGVNTGTLNFNRIATSRKGGFCAILRENNYSYTQTRLPENEGLLFTQPTRSRANQFLGCYSTGTTIDAKQFARQFVRGDGDSSYYTVKMSITQHPDEEIYSRSDFVLFYDLSTIGNGIKDYVNNPCFETAQMCGVEGTELETVVNQYSAMVDFYYKELLDAMAQGISTTVNTLFTTLKEMSFSFNGKHEFMLEKYSTLQKSTINLTCGKVSLPCEVITKFVPDMTKVDSEGVKKDILDNGSPAIASMSRFVKVNGYKHPGSDVELKQFDIDYDEVEQVRENLQTAANLACDKILDRFLTNLHEANSALVEQEYEVEEDGTDDDGNAIKVKVIKTRKPVYELSANHGCHQDHMEWPMSVLSDDGTHIYESFVIDKVARNFITSPIGLTSSNKATCNESEIVRRLNDFTKISRFAITSFGMTPGLSGNTTAKVSGHFTLSLRLFPNLHAGVPDSRYATDVKEVVRAACASLQGIDIVSAGTCYELADGPIVQISVYPKDDKGEWCNGVVNTYMARSTSTPFYKVAPTVNLIVYFTDQEITIPLDIAITDGSKTVAITNAISQNFANMNSIAIVKGNEWFRAELIRLNAVANINLVGKFGQTIVDLAVLNQISNVGLSVSDLEKWIVMFKDCRDKKDGNDQAMFNPNDPEYHSLTANIVKITNLLEEIKDSNGGNDITAKKVPWFVSMETFSVVDKGYSPKLVPLYCLL